jgi:hypothetical protein
MLQDRPLQLQQYSWIILSHQDLVVFIENDFIMQQICPTTFFYSLGM